MASNVYCSQDQLFQSHKLLLLIISEKCVMLCYVQYVTQVFVHDTVSTISAISWLK